MSRCTYRGAQFVHKASARWGVFLDLVGVAWTYNETTRRFTLPGLGIDLLPWFGAVSPRHEDATQLGRPIALVSHVGMADPELLAMHPDHADVVYVSLGVDPQTFTRAAAFAAKALKRGRDWHAYRPPGGRAFPFVKPGASTP